MDSTAKRTRQKTHATTQGGWVGRTDGMGGFGQLTRPQGRGRCPLPPRPAGRERFFLQSRYGVCRAHLLPLGGCPWAACRRRRTPRASRWNSAAMHHNKRLEKKGVARTAHDSGTRGPGSLGKGGRPFGRPGEGGRGEEGYGASPRGFLRPRWAQKPVMEEANVTYFRCKRHTLQNRKRHTGR